MTCRFTEEEEVIHSFFTLELDEGEWPASCFRPFTTWKRTLGSHWVSRAGLDFFRRREKYLAPAGSRIPDLPARSPVIIPTWSLWPIFKI